MQQLNSLFAYQTLQSLVFFAESSEYWSDNRDSCVFEKMESRAPQRLTSRVAEHPVPKFKKPRAPRGFWNIESRRAFQYSRATQPETGVWADQFAVPGCCKSPLATSIADGQM